MRLAMSLNAAGDIRLRTLRPRRVSRAPATVPPVLLVCSSKFQEMTTSAPKTVPAGFGSISTRNTFTRYARGFLRELGALVDGGKRHLCSFLTGTLPGSTPDALGALAAYSGWAVQTITNWVRDAFPGSQWFGVWEYQKRGALHMHICVQSPDVESATRLKRQWKARWIRLLESIGRRAGVDLFARSCGASWSDLKWLTRTDAQTVEKSVACYLGKYLSKGSARVRRRCEYPPSSWWFASRALQSQARQARREVQITQLDLGSAIELFERTSSLLAESLPTAYGYVCPYDCSIKGLIALGSPLQSSMLWDYLASCLRVLEGRRDADRKGNLSAVDYACIIFGATPICPEDITGGCQDT